MSTKGKKRRQLRGQYCQITLQGELDPSWSEWFNGLQITRALDENGMQITCLKGAMPDQGALRGVMNKLWDLNLTLLSFECKNLI
jgi:hypothetical protein